MELRHLKYFITVAKELHFSRAAELLQMAQPPLSQQIKQLEEEMGVKLFNRTQRRVELTEAGVSFYERACELLENLNFACDEAQKIHLGEKGDIILGFTGSPTFHILPRVLQVSKQEYPELKIELKELTTAEQVRALNKGEIHVGLLVPPINSNLLNIETLNEGSFVIALPKKHPLVKQGAPVDLSSLANENFLMPRRKDGPGYYDAMMNLCYQAGFEPNIILEAKQYLTFISLVSFGIGVALLPSSIKFIDREEVELMPIGNSLSNWTVSVAWNKNNRTPALQIFLKLLKKTTLYTEK
ncbi:LysR family transcriptional regulator [Bacillus sp. FJAT-49705]|uniref:LysR family transcriptional regulator n=1 Tax=Cytobacillus citreus TaxID=2833586 RepID=A0ABS5NWW0_9BACI|nr:LysR substrate-binding domain-containing protein [Cytobacillus citreus]MBS4192330.1 LysR family transcriptional regulator [Cytobacillus citreus]